MFVLISWWFLLLREKIPLTKADEYLPFKLQFISFLIKFEPTDRIKVSDTLLVSCSILLYEYFILSFSNLSIL